MKDLLATLAVGIPAFLLVVGSLIGLHAFLGENTGPALVLTVLVLGASFGVGAFLRHTFSSTTVMYRLKRWVRS